MRVKYSCYRTQRLHRQDEKGGVSFYYVWTLFVIWMDDTMDFWFRAKDVNDGVGFDTSENMNDMKKYLSGEDVLVEWEKIFPHLCAEATHSPDDSAARGLLDCTDNFADTPFLTEEGLYEVYQFAPQCRKFCRTVIELLRSVRQKIGNTVEITTNEQLERTVDERVAAVSDRERSGYDNRIAFLNERLNEAKRDLENRINTVQTKRISELKLEKDLLRKEHDDQIRNLTTRIDEYENKVVALKNEIVATTERLIGLDEHNRTMERELGERRKTIVRLEGVIGTINNTVVTLRTSHNELKRKYDQETRENRARLHRERIDRRITTNDMKRLRRKNLEYTERINRMNNVIDRCSFLHVDAQFTRPEDLLASCMVYVGQCLTETVWRNCFLCVHGPRKHIRKTLIELYTRLPMTNVVSTRNKTLNRMINSGHLKPDMDHLYDSQRMEGIDSLFETDKDAFFNDQVHKRILMDGINSMLLRTPRLVGNGVSTKNETSNGLRSADEIINEENDFDIEDLNDPRTFPFRLYEPDVYVCTKYFNTVEDAFDQFELYSRLFSRVESLGMRLEMIESMFERIDKRPYDERPREYDTSSRSSESSEEDFLL